MAGLLKFFEQHESNGRKVFWGRADTDGAPFRGNAPPLLREEEWENRTVRVYDAHNGTFDTADQEQNKKYLAVLDGVANGWYQLVSRQHHFHEGKTLVYVEWLEPFMEDSKPDMPRRVD